MSAYVTLSELRSANDKFAKLRPLADKAAEHEHTADRSKGSAGIMAVYMIAAAIRAEAFVFPNSATVNRTLDVKFTVNHARDIAKLWYDRFAAHCSDDPIISKMPTIISRKDTDVGASAWISDCVSMLYPYTCLNVTYDTHYFDKKKYGWEITRSQLNAKLDAALNSTNKNNKITQKEYDAQKKALDNVDFARAMARRYFPIACLYTQLDNTGQQIDKCDMSKPWLSCQVSWFMHRGWVAKEIAGPNCVIKPARGEAVYLDYSIPNTETGSAGQRKQITTSIANLVAAWRLPKPENVGDAPQDIADLMDAVINFKLLDVTFDKKQRASFDALVNVVVLKQQQIAAEERKAKLQATPPEAKSATTIAAQVVEGTATKSVPANMLKDGTPAPRMAS